MPTSAADILRTYDSASIGQMVRHRELPTKEKTKEKMIAVLAPLLFDPKAIARTLADLTPIERALVDQLILAGGSSRTGLIRRQLERDGLVDPPPKRESSSYYGYYGRGERGSTRNRTTTRKFEDVVTWLGLMGLVFTSEPTGSGSSMLGVNAPGRRLFIPEQILRHLPSVEMPVETMPPPAIASPSDPALLLRDFYLLLSFAARESIQMTSRGAINKRTLGRIAQELRRKEDVAAVRGEEELAWLPLLRALGEELGLLASAVGELVLDPRAEEFLRLPAGERRQRLFEAYRRNSHWCEVFRIPDLSVRGKGASLRVAPPIAVAARQRVLAELTKMPVGEWIALDHLVSRIGALAYEFLFSRRGSNYGYRYYDYSYYHDACALPNPYHGDNGAGWTFDDVESEQEGWEQVEAEFIRVVVTEALPAFGVVDLGGEGTTANAFRVTDDGTRLLRGEPLPSVASASHVVVQPNFQIFAFEPTGEDVLFTLDQIAGRVRAEQATEYELTHDSFYRAQRAGYDTAQILGFLESVSTVELPQNVRRTLEEWGSQHERITVRQRTPLLHSLDETTLDELYGDPEIVPLLGRRLAPTAALVSAINLKELSDRLIAGNRLPALTEGPDDVPGPRLTVDGEGRLAFRQRLPTVYDLRLIRPFTDEDAGAMRLTATSLRRGATTGLAADEILTTLERLQAEPLLPEVAALVRRWAKDWGSGALFQSAILHVDQPETLNDLLADPEVRSHLQRLPGASTVALVHPDSIDGLRGLLESRGMSLDDQPPR
jgi:hypothetical protein